MFLGRRLRQGWAALREPTTTTTTTRPAPPAILEQKKNRHDCGNQKSTLTYTFAAARPSTHLSLLCNTTLSASLVFLPLADGASFFYGMFLSLDLDLYLYRVLYTGCFQVVSVSEY